ncbi:hypothetical protein CDAR_275631 [Caerostris darwini]|uniref:Uncharacterized protein n=1 Tax=Caerostris darwini TaxID=1538125 RepID=A0AAV4UMX0_9ARAC|nr:hypothetical protein CDAR_275631 [Caerostris darwini]
MGVHKRHLTGSLICEFLRPVYQRISDAHSRVSGSERKDLPLPILSTSSADGAKQGCRKRTQLEYLSRSLSKRQRVIFNSQSSGSFASAAVNSIRRSDGH